MKNTLVRAIQSSLQKIGLNLRRTTDKKKVVRLIKSLHPYKTEFNLIRFGPNNDGGYLIPDDLEGIEACFSPGVGKITGFEEDCFKYGMKLFLADKSVEKPNLNIPESDYDFKKKFISCLNNESFMTIENWLKSSTISPTSDLLLQMDIEEGEYISIVNMSEPIIKRFRIISIEFHSLDDFWEPRHFSLAEIVFNKLLKTHICIHIHPNNYSKIHSLSGIAIPKVAEFTFIRKDRVKSKSYQTQFPHPLDADNTKNKPSIPLPKNWYKNTSEAIK